MSEYRRSSFEFSPVPGYSFGVYIHRQEVGGRKTGRIYEEMVYCYNIDDCLLPNRISLLCGIFDARSYEIYCLFWKSIS